MCGICGFNWDDKKFVKEMMRIQSHRGPDQSGFFNDKRVSLGHNRLSIIDLSVKGKQPLSNEDNTVWLVFNGEIYNFQILREDLIKKGHSFNSNTDSEVIVHAYEEYGEGCVGLFSGMFAFCIYDSVKKTLFLARDGAGIKPLYYVNKNGSFLFASEIKALLLGENVSRELDHSALHRYFTFRYVPGNVSVFSDVKKLEPGHFMSFDLVSKKLSIKKFWDVVIKPEKKSISHFKKAVNDAFVSSVKDRLISDVPLGAFLSGGLDSSYLVGTLSKLLSEPVKTFSIGFNFGNGYDESEFARYVAEHYGTDHHEIFLESDSFKLLPTILWHMDEPISDFASIPTYVLSEFAKKKVSVVLTGEGSDELFGGYDKYKYMKYYAKYHGLTPQFLRKAFSGLVGSSSGVRERMKDFNNSKTISEAYLNLISFFNEKEKKDLLVDKDVVASYKNTLGLVSNFLGRGKKMVSAVSALDFKTWLPEDLLMKVDKNTLAHALEARVPFLDKRMIELAGKIPPSLKLRGRSSKFILRQAMKPVVPKKIYERKKHGFNVPVHDWLANDLKEGVANLLSEESVKKRGLFNYSYVEKVMGGLRSQPKFYSRQLWLLTNFELWARIYLDGTNIKKKPNINKLL